MENEQQQNIRPARRRKYSYLQQRQNSLGDIRLSSVITQLHIALSKQ